MGDSEKQTMTPPPERSGVIAGALVVACLLALVLSVDGAVIGWLGGRIYTLTTGLAPGLLLALACIGLGDLILRLCYCSRRKEPALAVALPHADRLLLAFVCGIGILACGAFALGFSGAMNRVSSNGLLIVGALLGIPLWRSVGRAALLRISQRREPPTFASIVVGALLLIAIACVVAIAFTPPLIFDVTEYHLGAWTDYHRASDSAISGAARFIREPHNFYARFPFPLESLYYLGLSASPYVDTAPKIFNAVCILFCALLSSRIASRLGARRAGTLLASLVAVTHPVMLDVSIDAMIDAPTALLVASAVYAAFLAGGIFPGNDRPAPSLVVPAAFMFGSALAAKYTVAQIYLLPWLILAAPLLIRKNWRANPLLLICAAVVAAIPCVLWFGKNVVFYGNPLEPFFESWFRPADLAAIAREKFYIESHFPQSPFAVVYWTSLVPRLASFKWLLLVPCAGWMFRERRGPTIRVLLIAALAWLSWNTVRESQDRFLLPAILLLAPVATSGALAFPTRALRRAVAALLVIFAMIQLTRFSLTLHESEVADYLINFTQTSRSSRPTEDGLPTARESFYKKNLGDLGESVNQLNRALPPNARLLLIYEARPYLLRADAIYNVVWDDSVFLNIIRYARTADEAWELLQKTGITHILVNRQELLRYIRQYARKAQLLRLGVGPKNDPGAAWSATAHPEDLYPPFYRDRDWQRLRPIVHELLDKINERATQRNGLEAPQPGIKPLDITVTPLL